MTENVKILALRLLDRFDEHISAQLLLLYSWDKFSDPRFDWTKGPMGFTGLHGVAFLGLVEIAAAVLDMKKWDVNVANRMGSTALTWAAMRGHSGVVKILLERKDVNPNQRDTKSGRTPLSWAAAKGHGGIVKILLEREDVNPNQADTEYGQTPLSWAAQEGHSGVVKMLLEQKDVNPNQAGTEPGRTPLSWAAENGHSGVVKMLLGREDVNLNQPDTKCGLTPLAWAVVYGKEIIVKMLLERKDVRTGIPDNKNQMLLTSALAQGHGGIAKAIPEWDNANSGGQASLGPFAGNVDECAAEMQFPGNDSSPYTSTLMACLHPRR